MLQNNITEKRTFYGRIFKLVLPIIIQNLLSSAVSSADVIMLNYVGQGNGLPALRKRRKIPIFPAPTGAGG